VDDGFEVVDLGSRNGTRVNGQGVARQRLDDGDEILVGAVPIRFEMG
jgi:pSer/pThr/pTyr-binding forkhead associated (FHA) protein